MIDPEGYTNNDNETVKGVSSIIEGKASQSTGLERLSKLIKINMEDTNHINRNVMNILRDKEVLLAAYQRIKSKAGNMTKGPDSETLDGIDIKYFSNLEKALQTGRFQFRPARRIEIPKPGKPGEFRPLSIAPPRDKIVQQAMLFILEAIFEPTFSTHSHGFRPKRGCVTALGEIKRTFTAVN